jgi:hypothetical protein
VQHKPAFIDKPEEARLARRSVAYRRGYYFQTNGQAKAPQPIMFVKAPGPPLFPCPLITRGDDALSSCEGEEEASL